MTRDHDIFWSHAGLTHADQRITEDVEKFCFAVADLYSYTFKPLLDVLLFTRSLAKSMGYRTQAGPLLLLPGDRGPAARDVAAPGAHDRAGDRPRGRLQIRPPGDLANCT